MLKISMGWVKTSLGRNFPWLSWTLPLPRWESHLIIINIILLILIVLSCPSSVSPEVDARSFLGVLIPLVPIQLSNLAPRIEWTWKIRAKGILTFYKFLWNNKSKESSATLHYKQLLGGGEPPKNFRRERITKNFLEGDAYQWKKGRHPWASYGLGTVKGTLGTGPACCWGRWRWWWWRQWLQRWRWWGWQRQRWWGGWWRQLWLWLRMIFMLTNLIVGMKYSGENSSSL